MPALIMIAWNVCRPTAHNLQLDKAKSINQAIACLIGISCTFDRRRSSTIIQNRQFAEDTSRAHSCQQFAMFTDFNHAL